MRLAIIGAGVAGCGAAYALRHTDISVTIFESTNRVGGRAITVDRGDYRYDPGANYIKHGDGRTTQFLRELGTEDLVDIEPPIWLFDVNGTIREGDTRPSDRHKWTYTTGIQTVATRLLEATSATMHRNTPVRTISRTASNQWLVRSDEGENAEFDTVIVTPPAPITRDILSDDIPGVTVVLDEADTVTYRSILTVVLQYSFPLDVPYYALVNLDREHPIGWVSREECKPGRVPNGESVLIVQMAPEWSVTNAALSPSEIQGEVTTHVAQLFQNDSLLDPNWMELHRFTHALPNNGISEPVQKHCESNGLFIAGDWISGEGRVHEALFTGVDVGTRIATATS